LEAESRALAQSLRDLPAEKAGDREKLTAELREKLERTFDARMEGEQQKLDELRERLAKVEQRLAKRKQNRQLIVDRRLADLTGDSTLAWDEDAGIQQFPASTPFRVRPPGPPTPPKENVFIEKDGRVLRLLRRSIDKEQRVWPNATSAAQRARLEEIAAVEASLAALRERSREAMGRLGYAGEPASKEETQQFESEIAETLNVLRQLQERLSVLQSMRDDSEQNAEATSDFDLDVEANGGNSEHEGEDAGEDEGVDQEEHEEETEFGDLFG
jgi:hypothetical protein